MPQDGAVRVAPLTPVSFTFDEPMKRRTVEPAVTIVPPVRWASIRWSETRLELAPAEPLRPATTYVAVLGARAQDSHGNRLGAAYHVAFTTGDSLPEGSVTGKVQPLLGGRAPLVFAIGNDGAADSMAAAPRPEIARALSVAESDTGGVFVLPHLPADASVWIVAYTDRNDNGSFDEAEQEPWGWHPLPVRPRAGAASAPDTTALFAVPQFDPRGQGMVRGVLHVKGDTAGTPRALLVASLEADSTTVRALAPQGAGGSFLWPLAAGRYRAGAFRDMDGDGIWGKEKGEPVLWNPAIVDVSPDAVAGPVALDAPPPLPPAPPDSAAADSTRADSTRTDSME